MERITRTSLSSARRALVRHLPQTRAELMKSSSRRGAKVLRVLYSQDAAFDYVLLEQQWHRVGGSPSGAESTFQLELDANAGLDAFATVVARDIAVWHRRIAFPLAGESPRSSAAEWERAESVDRLDEAQRFLASLSRGEINCSADVRSMADEFWNQTDDEIVDSLAEQHEASRAQSADVAA